MASARAGEPFSLEGGGYDLRFNFQGSNSNGLYASWQFFINTGVEFEDLEPEPFWSFFAHTHWAGRIEDVVAGSPQDWRYDLDTDRDSLAEELAGLIGQATANVSSDIERMRSEYLVKKAAQQARNNTRRT